VLSVSVCVLSSSVECCQAVICVVRYCCVLLGFVVCCQVILCVFR